MKKNIYVNLNERSYSISIGKNIVCTQINNLLLKGFKKIVIITNSFLKKILLKDIFLKFPQLDNKKCYFSIPDGEQYKNFKETNKIITFLLKNKYDRSTVLLALGGGVIGDITAFVASIYQRGISVVHIPTTLLSQIDSSIGGKTGINHTLGKNMIGSFWQPNNVIIDIKYLKTLPKIQIISGISEIIKYAIAFDNLFFNWLEENICNILNLQEDSLFYCIQKCCNLKVKIIEKDEREENCRVFLNLGHTFAHAIESFLGYGKWLHGQAVSVGIIIASYLSNILGYISHSDLERIKNLFSYSKLPINTPKNMSEIDYFKFMSRDKKNLNNRIRLVLPISIGSLKVFDNVENQLIIDAIKKSKIE